MKKALLTLSLACAFLGLEAQKNVTLHFVQKAGTEDFALQNTFTTDEGYPFMPTRLQYYLSLPSVTHDGGQTFFSNNRYFLVNGGEDAYLDLGEMPVETIEAITFSIGVDEARNHLDPAQYPANHPLALQNPSMHWGWAGGYRFIAMEGDAGSSMAYSFEIHSIGDELYRTVTIATEAEAEGDGLIIHLQADYNKLLKDIDVSGGLIAHGTLGACTTIMDNIGSIVFSPLTTSSTTDPAFSGSFSVMPNPTSAETGSAMFYLPAGYDYQLTMADLTGRVLSSQPLQEGYVSAGLEAPGAGMYLVQLWQNGRPVATEKWVVTQ